ncbi:hypothetical protein TI39_contig336g00005 [Zymoseptoria brevis]|uniref:Uncharacterized protein n=1 Tax=Zymoseptoria brevis TaxID=1047168 RepID=A0A0F4GVU6_9PEZI|nr:hypothetical protein TI39_contig336g00005 [Zymoseptoria brevis]
MATDLDSNAKLEHHFKGDTELLAKTASARAEVRKALATLQQEVQKYSASPCQIQADIKFNVLGPIAKEHIYSVDIRDRKFDQDLFARTKILAGKTAAKGTAGSPSGSAPRASHDDDEVVEVRPFKRIRTEESNGQSSPRSRGLGSFSADITATERIEGTHKLMQTWHNEWTSQGGWLFDTLTNAAATSTTNHTALLTKLDVVQDVLGQSINASTATTMAELGNIAKLIPWLEHCRKANADKVQSREEKWRSSSATFHDQNRRERETAEKRIEEKLEKQRELLVKIAEANGVDVEDDDEEDKRSEVSLGAQLTAELNLEASRAARDGTDSRKNSSITIDD